MGHSSVPAAVDALVAMFGAAATLADVQVYDGTIPTNPADDYVAVAVAAPDSPSVDGTVEWAALGARRQKENGTQIGCQVSSWSGGDTMKARRDRAFVLYDACVDAVLADPTLQSTVVLAAITHLSVIGEDSPQGPVCTINFDVTLEQTRI